MYVATMDWGSTRITESPWFPFQMRITRSEIRFRLCFSRGCCTLTFAAAAFGLDDDPGCHVLKSLMHRNTTIRHSPDSKLNLQQLDFWCYNFRIPKPLVMSQTWTNVSCCIQLVVTLQVSSMRNVALWGNEHVRMIQTGFARSGLKLCTKLMGCEESHPLRPRDRTWLAAALAMSRFLLRFADSEFMYLKIKPTEMMRIVSVRLRKRSYHTARELQRNWGITARDIFPSAWGCWKDIGRSGRDEEFAMRIMYLFLGLVSMPNMKLRIYSCALCRQPLCRCTQNACSVNSELDLT